jgi:hypothetical protein
MTTVFTTAKILIPDGYGGGFCYFNGKNLNSHCSARDWDGKDYLRIIPRVVW